jgi:hypothetical protein
VEHKSLHTEGSLMTVSKELLKYKFDFVEVQRSDGRTVTPNQKNTHLTERELVMN